MESKLNEFLNSTSLTSGNVFQLIGKYPSVPTPDPFPVDLRLHDKYAPECLLCQTSFTTTKRKHHCRHCGLVYCASCSSQVYTPGSIAPGIDERRAPEKICDTCLLLKGDVLNQELPGIRAMAIKEGLVSNESYGIADQTEFALTYFAQLLVNQEPQIRQLALLSLVKITERPDAPLSQTILQHITDIILGRKDQNERNLAYEVLSNLFGISRLSQSLGNEFLKLPGVLEHLKEMSLLGNFTSSSARFYFNFCYFQRENYEVIREIVKPQQILMLVREITTAENMAVQILVHASLYYIIRKSDELQRMFTDCGGTGYLMYRVLDYVSGGEDLSDIQLFFKMMILSTLATSSKSAEVILSFGYTLPLGLLRKVKNPGILLSNVDFVENLLLSSEGDSRRLSDELLLTFLVESLRMDGVEKKVRIRTLQMIAKVCESKAIKEKFNGWGFSRFLNFFASRPQGGLEVFAGKALEVMRR